MMVYQQAMLELKQRLMDVAGQPKQPVFLETYINVIFFASNQVIVSKFRKLLTLICFNVLPKAVLDGKILKCPIMH